jgi:hypothetical protein
MVARLDDLGASGFMADPIVGAEDTPNSFTAESETITGNSAQVLLATSFGTQLTVELPASGDAWKITDIKCR